jgi:hypothetical protein
MNIRNLSLGFWDIGLTKLSVFFFTLFLVSVWEGLANWVMDTHWAWFLVASLVIAIKPIITVLKE